MSLLDAGYKLSNDLLLTVTLRSGDYNLDGYPDVLVPVQNGSSVALSLWQNVPCSDTLCASDATTAGARTFQVVTKGVGALSSIKPYAGSFIDIGEQGILDILISAEDSTIKGLWNSFVNDAYFLKALGSNGICPGWCSTSPKFPNPKPYGVNFPGGMFKWTVTNTKGSRRGAIGVQLSQSAYMALQTPYVFMGLGRTSNYIDTMFYGISSNQAVHTNSWSGIIPNSQVAAFPYKIEKPATWTMEMYISPSGILFWVIVACVLACLILASLIGYLTYREHVQDKQEEQEKGFAFNKL